MALAKLSRADEEQKKNIAERIQARVNYLGLEQAKVARKIHVHRATYSRWHRGETVIDSLDMLRIAAALDCTVGYLYGEYDEAEEAEQQFLAQYRALPAAQKVAARTTVESLWQGAKNADAMKNTEALSP